MLKKFDQERVCPEMNDNPSEALNFLVTFGKPVKNNEHPKTAIQSVEKSELTAVCFIRNTGEVVSAEKLLTLLQNTTRIVKPRK